MDFRGNEHLVILLLSRCLFPLSLFVSSKLGVTRKVEVATI